MNRLWVGTSFGLLAVVVLWSTGGCNGQVVADNASVDTPSVPAPSGGAVGRDGGTITSADGQIIVEIPPGALDTPVAITATPVASVPIPGHTLVGTTYQIEPKSLTLAKPAKISLRFIPTAFVAPTTPADIRVMRADDAVSSFTPITTSLGDAAMVSVISTRLGTFVPAVPVPLAVIPAALQSPVPDDAPCTVAPGAPVLIYAGEMFEFAIDGTFLYVEHAHGVSRVPLTGGPPETVLTTTNDILTIGLMAIGAGKLLSEIPKYSMVPISGDAFVPPAYPIQPPTPGTAFDGVSFYSYEISNTVPATDTLHRMPANGSPEVATKMPLGMGVQAMLATPDGLFAAVLLNRHLQPVEGQIVKIPLDGSGLVTIAANLGVLTNGIAVDDKYIYYGDTPGSHDLGGLQRMALDGTGITTLSQPVPESLVVDKHSVYFRRNGAIYKVDKIARGEATLIGPALQNGGLLVYGGNVYWGAPDGQGVYTACK